MPPAIYSLKGTNCDGPRNSALRAMSNPSNAFMLEFESRHPELQEFVAYYIGYKALIEMTTGSQNWIPRC